MKKLLVSLFALLIVATVLAQQKKVTDLINFAEVKHDFGKIKQNTPVNYNFTFKNVANKPVVIESATASCGCTTPAWPKTPVMQSKSDKITAGFNAAAPGPFNKTIYVKVAGIDQPMELIITGEVLTPADYARYEADKSKKKQQINELL